MIVREFLRTRKDGVKLYRTYSNKNMKIQKFGTKETYNEAIDVASAITMYVETQIPIIKEGGIEDE